MGQTCITGTALARPAHTCWVVQSEGLEGMLACLTRRRPPLCRNIRHALFQKATKSEVACIVHFHLHNPIMVGQSSSCTCDVPLSTSKAPLH